MVGIDDLSSGRWAERNRDVVALEEAVIGATGTDKKHAGGRLRWVLPTADATVVRDDALPR